MHTLEDYLKKHDTLEEGHFFKQMKERGRLRFDVKSEKDFNKIEREKFNDMIRRHDAHRRKHWELTLSKILKYTKKPFMVNHSYIAKPILRNKKVVSDESEEDHSDSSSEEVEP